MTRTAARRIERRPAHAAVEPTRCGSASARQGGERSSHPFSLQMHTSVTVQGLRVVGVAVTFVDVVVDRPLVVVGAE
ncbi:e8e4a0a6-d204-46b9-ae26-d8f60ba8a40e [Thermothielavioides terrestris]|uniref:E8e4a0a6-d204-46b9-ae26-d8f60ba8a40e n=1 Tax=Thermothielavioides terrestris TaxID=2587410 RepID=A0A3S4BBI5_9PEZI|nr:e8e4a0a6-d204-46b9-ae26-d8f60ba8a40e [Thermothielavioides terrestris]